MKLERGRQVFESFFCQRIWREILRFQREIIKFIALNSIPEKEEKSTLKIEGTNKREIEMFFFICSSYSLVVFLLASRANKYNYLLGAINSVIYSIGFFMEGLYAGVISALVFSFGLQIITFFRWNKNSYKQQNVLVPLKCYLQHRNMEIQFDQ